MTDEIKISLVDIWKSLYTPEYFASLTGEERAEFQGWVESMILLNSIPQDIGEQE